MQLHYGRSNHGDWLLTGHEPPRYHLDHLALKMKIPSATNQAHHWYLYSRSQLPVVQAAADEGEPNAVFTQLLSHHERPVAPTFPAHDGWIAPDTW